MDVCRRHARDQAAQGNVDLHGLGSEVDRHVAASETSTSERTGVGWETPESGP
jgi:hypothetical protein